MLTRFSSKRLRTTKLTRKNETPAGKRERNRKYWKTSQPAMPLMKGFVQGWKRFPQTGALHPLWGRLPGRREVLYTVRGAAATGPGLQGSHLCLLTALLCSHPRGPQPAPDTPMESRCLLHLYLPSASQVTTPEDSILFLSDLSGNHLETCFIRSLSQLEANIRKL